MNKFINTLVIILFTTGAQANKSQQNELMQGFIEHDLALLQSLEKFAETQATGFIKVGGDADPNWCDYSSLQSAINAAPQLGITEIRVAYNKTYSENISIDNIDISLVGGYSSCQSAGSPFSAPNSNQALINGGGNGTVVTVTGDTNRNTVLLKNLRLINGSVDGCGGGMSVTNESLAISLKNVDVRNNSAYCGGGIYTGGDDIDMLLLDSLVISNNAERGGGISCGSSTGQSSVVLSGESGVVANIATGVQGGGGVYLGGCHFGLYSGTSTTGAVGIAANRAHGPGGGIAAWKSSISINGQQYCPASGACLGNNTQPASVRSNHTDADPDSWFPKSGGGISANGSTVIINAGYIEYNTSDGAGGGLAMYFSNLDVKRTGKTCWHNQRCNLFAGNYADGSGGAILAWGNSKIDVSASVFEDNTASSGAVLYAFSSYLQGEARIEGSVINNNGNSSSDSILFVGTGSGLEIVHSTIADNIVSSADLGAGIIKAYELFIEVEEIESKIPPLNLFGSIFDNPGFKTLSHNMYFVDYLVDFTCIIAHETVSLLLPGIVNDAENRAGGAYILRADPKFLNRKERQYKLTSNSPAIDYCNTPTYTDVGLLDIEFQARGVDDPDHSDNYFLSFFDIGADEAYLSNLIFNDSFE